MPQRTILVADDETHILNVLSIKLQNAGFNVLTAEDGAEAYALARSARPDLIITDYQMPQLSGLELCSKLQCDPLTRDLPAILLTARGFDIPEPDRTAGNIREVIAKPFSPRQVLTSVYQLLDELTAGCGVQGSECGPGQTPSPEPRARSAMPADGGIVP